MVYLITTDMDILNKGTILTFRNSVREEVIDIALCIGSIWDKVKKWRVSDEPSLSYHMQILYELESHALSVPTRARNPRKTNWDCHFTDLQAALQGITVEWRPTGGIGSLRSSIKKSEKDSDGPRKAIRKNCGTYPMQLGMHASKRSGRPRVIAGPHSVQI